MKNYKTKLLTGGISGAILLTFLASAGISSAAPSVATAQPAMSSNTTPAHLAPSLTVNSGPLDVISAIFDKGETVEFSKALETQIKSAAFTKGLLGKISPGAITATQTAYTQSAYKPLWKKGAAEHLFDLPQVFESHGLEASLTTDDINSLIEQRFESDNPDERASAEIALTVLWLKFTSKISGGLSDKQITNTSLSPAPTNSHLVNSLEDAAKGHPVKEMESFASKAPQYANLRLALSKYKKDVSLGGWLAIPRDGGLIEPGAEDTRIPALRERLRAEGYLPYKDYFAFFTKTSPETEDLLYDEELEEAVKAFQTAHTMNADGVVGPATLAAMNESPGSNIQKIKDALDYWRHLDAFNQMSGDRYIWVNIPSFRAEAWNKGKLDVSMKTIVGKANTPTPDFSDEVEYIVANPKWFLPISLFKRQKLGKLRADPGYAAAHKYKIYDRASGQELNAYNVDWYAPGISSKIQMVQSPGPHNALGELKIIFPNKNSVYLHSTPQKELFKYNVRAFSSGCIRLDDPVAMANWITDHDSLVDTKDFNETLQSRERKHFRIGDHVPVYITYVGVTATADGVPTFHRDIYRKLAEPSFVQTQYPRYQEGPIVKLDNKGDKVKQTAAALESVSALP